MANRCFGCWDFTLLIVTASIGFSNECRADNFAELHARFMSEAPQKWGEYRNRGRRLQGSCLITLRLGKATTCVHYDIKQNLTGASYLKQLLEGGNTTNHGGKLTVVNSRYGFQLQRPTKESDWFIGGVNPKQEDGFSLDIAPPDAFAWDFVNRAFNFSPFFSMSQSLPELMQDSAFSVTKVSLADSAAGDGLVRIEFSNHPHSVTGLQFKQNDLPVEWNDLVEGWVLLDPTHYWVFREFHTIHEYQSHNKGTSDAKFEYKIEPDGFPILTRIGFKYKGVDPRGMQSDQQGTFDFDSTEQDVPDSQFTLSAYGFPEPVGLDRRIPLYLWIAMIGLLCLIGATMTRWWYRRGKAARNA